DVSSASVRRFHRSPCASFYADTIGRPGLPRHLFPATSPDTRCTPDRVEQPGIDVYRFSRAPSAACQLRQITCAISISSNIIAETVGLAVDVPERDSLLTRFRANSGWPTFCIGLGRGRLAYRFLWCQLKSSDVIAR